MGTSTELSQNLKRRNLMFVMGLCLMLCGSLVFSWSVYVNPLLEAHGWSLTSVALVGTSASAFYSAGCFVGGWLRNKIGTKKVLITGTIGFMAGLFLSGLATSPQLLYVTYSGIAGLSAGFIYCVVTFAIGQWFPDRKGLMMACVLAVWGGSSAFVGPLVTALIGAVGVINVFYIEAVVFGAICLVCSFLFKEAPEGFNPYPEKVAVTPSNQRNYYLPQAIRTWPFWAHLIAMAIYPAFYQCMSSLFVTFGLDNGFSQTMATAILSIVSICSIIGRIGFGQLVDKTGWKLGYAAHWIIMSAGGIGLILFRGNPALLIVSFVLIGIGFGAVASTNAVIAMEEWGPKASGSVFGAAMLGYVPASLIVPSVGLNLMESSGSYIPLQVFGLICTAVGAVCALSIKPIKPDRFKEEG
ncbi:OFA family MFS transporter [Lachnospiraceae bacterium KGMB03038]|nr:OFA family MFS transporter [Lachnospiraceae bacterium KGMB03038]